MATQYIETLIIGAGRDAAYGAQHITEHTRARAAIAA